LGVSDGWRAKVLEIVYLKYPVMGGVGWRKIGKMNKNTDKMVEDARNRMALAVF